jgi:LytS/YehU family sensor histidine kinase
MILRKVAFFLCSKILPAFLICIVSVNYTLAQHIGSKGNIAVTEDILLVTTSGRGDYRCLLQEGANFGILQFTVNLLVVKSNINGFSRNTLQALKDHTWLFALILGLIVSGIIIYSVRRTRLIRERLENERRFAELQFKSLRNQLAPHFVFNALNAIGSSIYQDDKERAYDFLQQFSTLIRSTLVHADKTFRTLNEEIEFVRNYLDLERFRFENRFEYKFDIQEGIDPAIPVPKMIIQTFAENSIKHGLLNRQGKGFLSIVIITENEFLKIIVEDNGIGRLQSEQLKSGSTGKGMDIIAEFITLFNKFNEKKIQFKINDILSDSGTVAGTRVMIQLPVNFTYNSIQKPHESI